MSEGVGSEASGPLSVPGTTCKIGSFMEEILTEREDSGPPWNDRAGFLCSGGRRSSATRSQRTDPVARTGPLRGTYHHAVRRQPLVELVDVDVKDFAVLRPAGWIGGPDNISQFFGGDSGAALDGSEDAALDRRERQFRHNRLAAIPTRLGLRT